MMGGQSSKTKKSVDPPSPPLEGNTSSQFIIDLSSYELACKLDPELRSFDTALHERTNRVINTLSTGVEVHSMSFDSLREVTGCLLEMNQEVVKVILESKKGVWKNQDMFDLVEEYFDNSIKTLDFCNALENCLKRAGKSQLLVQLAVNQYEEELKLQNKVDEKRFVKTMEELNKFKEAGNPFTKEFFTLLQAVNAQQVSLLQKLVRRKRKLDKKLKDLKTWRRISNVLFVSAFVAVLIFSVVAAAVSMPPIIAALAGALTVPIGSVGKWCNSLWQSYEKTVKGEKGLVSSMQIGTFIQIRDIEHINVLVNKFSIEMESMINNVEIANRQEDALKLVIDEIKKRLEVFMETIRVLGEHAEKCSHDIKQARTVILHKILNNPGD